MRALLMLPAGGRGVGHVRKYALTGPQRKVSCGTEWLHAVFDCASVAGESPVNAAVDASSPHIDALIRISRAMLDT